jgi:hypothetical protein
MMINIQRIQTLLFFLLPAAVFLPSCNTDEGYPALRGGEAEIEMTFTRPATYAPGDNDEKINTLDLLVFQRQANGSAGDAVFVEKRYARPQTGNKYRSTIRIGDHLDIYFAVNVRSLLDGLVAGTTTYTQAREKLVLINPADLAENLSTNGLPMWGYLHDQRIADQAYTNLGTIKLLRSVASVDITVSATNFTLEKGHVVFSADKGYLPFSHDNIDDATYNVVSPEIPSGMKADVDLVFSGLTSTPPAQEIKNEFYMYENDAPLVAERRSTKVILEGVYTGSGGSGNTTFYPLAFRDAENQKLQIKRNWKYVLLVTKVNGDGYPSLEDAKDGEDLNMGYEVIEWNGNEDDNIQIIGSKYVANYASAVELYRPAGSEKKFVVRTNFTLDDFELALDNGGDFPIEDNMTEIENERFNVTITAAGANEILFTVTARHDYADVTGNPSILNVTVGRILGFTTTITQTNETPVDWIDGGNQDSGLGKS